MKCYSYLLILGFCLASACTNKISTLGDTNAFGFHPNESSFISLRNDLSIPRNGGHIQGIQFYQKEDRTYYFFSGSSANQSYLAIADAQSKKIIAAPKLMDEPYRHAGGFQIMDDLLVVGIEDNEEKDKSWIHLYRIDNPDQGDLKLLQRIERKGSYKRMTAGSVALTEYNQSLYICVGNWDNHDLDLYRLPTDKLESPDQEFELVSSLNSENLNRSNWVEKSWFSYQNINFFWKKDQLFMAAMAEEILGGKQLLDIFSCELEQEGLVLEKVFHQKFPKQGNAGFRWGGGVYMDEKGKLQIMTCGELITDKIEVRYWK